MKANASARDFSQSSVRSEMFPPVIVWNVAPRVPSMERERTVTPRTTPRLVTMRWGGSSNAVVTIAGFNGDLAEVRVVRLCGSRAAGGAAGRPRPEEIVPPNGPERINCVTPEEQPGMAAALHGARIHLGKADAAASHFGLLVPFVARPGELAMQQRVEEPAPLVAGELRERARRLHLRALQEESGQAVGHQGSNRSQHRPCTLRPQERLHPPA